MPASSRLHSKGRPDRRVRLRLGLSAVSAVLFLTYCQTTPEPEPEPDVEVATVTELEAEVALVTEPEVEPEIETVQTETVVAPKAVSEGELRPARVAVARAEEAEAHFYDPASLAAARADLAQAQRLRESDPDAARAALVTAKGSADRAYERSVVLATQRFNLLMDDRLERLREIEADKFTPSEYAAATAAVELAREQHAAGELRRARDTATAVLSEMQLLHAALRGQLDRVTALRRDTEDLLDQAQAAAAHIHAPDQFAQLNSLYLGGVEELQGYDLAAAERMFGAAREAGGDTLLAARREREAVAEEEIDALMLEVMRKLEAASLLTIVTDDGQVIEPEPWVGSSLIEPRAGGAEPEDTSALPIPSDGVAVLGQDVQDNLLVQARELWGLGVKEREAGNLRRALEYFQEAERYVDAFQAYAVQGVYTIRLIPERRDALWRIAEYDFIYGDPFLWPKIWRRNRKLIQNPDLIFPGWQLIIPPK